MKQQISNMEFGRRLATERDLEKSDVFHLCNIGMRIVSLFCIFRCIISIAIKWIWLPLFIFSNL